MSASGTGPLDLADIDPADGIERVDLGSLLVATTPGIDVQVQVDEASGQIVQLTFTGYDGAVQVQPYAAPKSGGLWDQVRDEIHAGITESGGRGEVREGTFGIELFADVVNSEGDLSPARFAGVEGPRWFVRLIFLGAATAPGNSAAALESMVRRLVVVRGPEAMASGRPLPLRLPDAQDAAPSVAVPALQPLERGPEITEIG